MLGVGFVLSLSLFSFVFLLPPFRFFFVSSFLRLSCLLSCFCLALGVALVLCSRALAWALVPCLSPSVLLLRPARFCVRALLCLLPCLCSVLACACPSVSLACALASSSVPFLPSPFSAFVLSLPRSFCLALPCPALVLVLLLPSVRVCPALLVCLVFLPRVRAVSFVPLLCSASRGFQAWGLLLLLLFL